MAYFAPREGKRGPCPDCGARTLRQAETRCRPTSDQDGEYSCVQPEDAVDAQGWFLQPTPIFYANLDAWVDDQLRKMHVDPAAAPPSIATVEEPNP